MKYYIIYHRLTNPLVFSYLHKSYRLLVSNRSNARAFLDHHDAVMFIPTDECDPLYCPRIVSDDEADIMEVMKQ